MQYTFQQISSILKTVETVQNTASIITNISIDSRQTNLTKNTLFFCIIGERNNGHQFIKNAYKNGIENFVTSEKIDFKKYPNANFFVVENTLVALQNLAIYHRQQFKIPVIGITGSNGKTIIKEWLYQLLSPEYNIVKSPKSYNSQVGVPLSIFNMNATHQLAIFEAGISTCNEMQFLQKMIQPTIGIFANIGDAHSAGFENQKQKTIEKAKLFSASKKIIYSNNYKDINDVFNQNKNAISFGNLDTSIFKILNFKLVKNYTTIDIKHQNTTQNYILPFQDLASIENILHCIILMLELQYKPEIIQQRIMLLHNLPMRLELKHGINNCTIIDDSYSADFYSLQIALDFYKQQETKKTKTLLLSVFEDNEIDSKIYLQKIQHIIQTYKFSKIILVGNLFVENIEMVTTFAKIVYAYTTTKELLNKIESIVFEKELILIKGARNYHFEDVVYKLIEQTHNTVFEISLNALIHNLNVYKNNLQPNVGIIAMVKAFSYGTGNIEIAALLEAQNVQYLAVAYADEGILLRRNGIKTPIMVMNPDVVDFEKMIEYNLEPEIYSIQILQHLIRILKNRNINIHLKIETGMNRLGFVETDFKTLITTLQNQKNIQVTTIFSHLSSSEDVALDQFTHQQIEHFTKHSNFIIQQLQYPIKRHILNSAGIVRFKNAQFDYVRLGIGLYGINYTNEIQNQLQTIGTLKTRIAQIKHIKKGETVGYNRKGIATKNTTIAILAIGYADGFDRRFSNGKGQVYINNQKAKIIGNVCMDMCMADITDIKDIHDGDTVEIFGKNISILEAANNIGTIAYELLTKISTRVKRIYYLD